MRSYDNDVIPFEINVCNNQGNLFEECQVYDYPCDAEDFVTKYMKSYICEGLDKELSNFHTYGTQQLFDESFLAFDIKNYEPNSFIDFEVMFWIGYITRYWTFWLGTSSNEIITKYGFKYLRSTYGLHLLGPQEAIQEMIITNALIK